MRGMFAFVVSALSARPARRLARAMARLASRFLTGLATATLALGLAGAPAIASQNPSAARNVAIVAVRVTPARVVAEEPTVPGGRTTAALPSMVDNEDLAGAVPAAMGVRGPPRG
jgi:hypothetical protein